MSMFTFNIDTHSGVHIYTQIYQYIRHEIESGSLACHSKLPSTRGLAAHLQVSRNTVDMAYGQLMDEGYIEAMPKRGYFVCDIENLMPPIAAGAKTSDYKPEKKIPGSSPYVFSPYGVDLENFPFNTWRKIAKDILYNGQNTELFQAGPSCGDQDFREAIAGYLHQSRGVICSPDQIIVGAGADYLLILLSQLLDNDSIYAIEDPSYLQAYKTLTNLGKKTYPVPLDKNGMSIDSLRQSGADIAYVTPSHQFPLGIIMPIKRRLELLRWAYESERRYIIEDDYDSEFRYKGKPVPSLQGIDRHGRVIYAGTFSKAIAPSIRISYLVLPPGLLEKYRQRLSYLANTVARTEQKQMTEFIVRGYFERHLNRMRNIYKSKRDYILQQLAPYAGHIAVSGENSGLHMLLTFRDGRNAQDILLTAQKANIRLFDLSSYYIRPEHCTLPHTVILGYGALSESRLKTQLPLLCSALFGSRIA